MSIYLKTVNSDSTAEISFNSLRWDIAWKLFLPEHPGDMPNGFPDMILSRITAWAWDSLGYMTGRMRVDRVDPIWFLVPPLTPAAEEYVIRIASFWDDEVYRITESGQLDGNNLWTPPVVGLHEKSTSPLEKAAGKLKEGARDYRIFFPQLGMGRLHIMLMTVEAGKASTRLHSHSTVDEYYLIVSGKGTLRMGTHSVPIETGNLIGKPSGPDLSSQILADRGESVTILDLEAWPDARQNTKDVMYYSDFGEIQLHNFGWSAVISDKALQSASDKKRNYENGYQRELDGSWISKDIPGTQTRRND